MDAATEPVPVPPAQSPRPCGESDEDAPDEWDSVPYNSPAASSPT